MHLDRLLMRGPLRGLAAIFIACLAVTGCRTRGEREVPMSGPDILYERAHKSLVSQDYDNAIKIYEALATRYPFAEQAKQGRLDVLYAYYKRREAESAIDAADQFIRENPTHPRIDYAWYIKGLVEFERSANALERLFRVDITQRPPTTARKSFASLRTLVEQYPKSEYAADARQRMIWLRNRLAEYETSVAKYYVKRGAYVAAAQRSKQAIEQYDGAPSTRDALAILIESYDRLGLADSAAQARKVWAANYEGEVRMASDATKKRPWWRPW